MICLQYYIHISLVHLSRGVLNWISPPILICPCYWVGSIFGGVLDMVTDRVSTCGLLAVLSKIYPDHTFIFLSLISIDIFSHWFHVMRWCNWTVNPCLYLIDWFRVSVTGHHKSKDTLKHRNVLLQWYYSIYPLFAYCCVGTEVFYVLLYVQYFWSNSTLAMVRLFDFIDWCNVSYTSLDLNSLLSHQYWDRKICLICFNVNVDLLACLFPSLHLETSGQSGATGLSCPRNSVNRCRE